MNRTQFQFVAIHFAALILGFSSTIQSDELVPANPDLKWWKGNIHTHSLWSDGDDFPEMIAEWYRTNGYNFLALSDHNVLSEGQRWMSYQSIVDRGGETGRNVVQKYIERFGKHWVETKGLPGLPSGDDYQIRLKPLHEFRSLVESRGEFMMIAGEEISDDVDGKPVHMNATNLEDLVLPLGGQAATQAISANLRAVREQAERKGREIIVHLNHPNFHYGVTAEEIASVIDEDFFEVYNGHPAINHLGDGEHPSVEKMWDIVCTLRIGHYNAPPIMGVATDDSHDYHGKPEGASTGRGWVMVRAMHLTPESIIRAMNRGEFYASSGVTLDEVKFEQSKQEITIKIAQDGDAQYETQFIGTRKPTEDNQLADNEPAVGEVLATVQGNSAHYELQGEELYARACVTSSAPHSNPSFDGQKKQAWTQPVGWKKHLKE